MRTRVAVASEHAPTLRTTAAALVFLAVVLAGVSGVARVGLSGEPPAKAVPQTAR